MERGHELSDLGHECPWAYKNPTVINFTTERSLERLMGIRIRRGRILTLSWSEFREAPVFQQSLWIFEAILNEML